MEFFMDRSRNKKIAILGVTGSVGTQASDVAIARGYEVDLISANKDVEGALRAVKALKPRLVVMTDKDAANTLATALIGSGIKVMAGKDGLSEAIHATTAETVVNAIIGEAGLMPTLAVIDAGKRLALANKESLVIAGDIVTSRAREKGVSIIPVDSEHSAIFQSMSAGKHSEVKRILLTASGGPFFSKSREELSDVTLSDALAHPTWKMGRKITIDSATLMNKGYEVIEAAHLFGIPAERVEVVVHRESILHSAVEYIDNTVIGEFSAPDMRMCVQYAVDYPDRCPSVADELDLFSIGRLTFARPDTEAFPLLALAKRSAELGGAMPAIVNAADEVAVGAFLEEKLSFLGISDVVSETFDRLTERRSERTLDGIIAADREAREIAIKLIGEKR